MRNIGKANIKLEHLEKLFKNCQISELSLCITSVHILLIASLQLGAEGAKQLANLIKEQQTVTSLQLYDNSMEDEGTSILSEAISKTNCVTFLDLSTNLSDLCI